MKKILCVLICLCVPSFPINASSRIDSNQESHLDVNRLSSVLVHASMQDNDTQAIQDTIRLLFETFANQLRELPEKQVEYDVFWSDSQSNRKHNDYTCNHFNELCSMWRDNGVVAENLQCDIDFVSLNISANNATAKVYFSFSYIDRTVDYTESVSGDYYTIQLFKETDGWRISDIESNEARSITADPIESDPLLVELIPIPSSAETEVTWERVSLNTTRLKSYASTYALSHNSLFPDYSADCQNFASQCIWYGLGGANNSAAVSQQAFPMVSSSTRGWSPSYSSWRVVDSFASYVSRGGSYKLGPYGTVTSGIASAQVGDIVQYDKEGNGAYNHSMVVVAVSGTSGSRTLSNITVCAHTGDYKDTLLSALGSSGWTWRTVHVSGAWYTQ